MEMKCSSQKVFIDTFLMQSIFKFVPRRNTCLCVLRGPRLLVEHDRETLSLISFNKKDICLMFLCSHENL